MAFTGNNSHTVSTYSAFSVAKAVEREWSMIFTQTHPLIEALADGGTNFNQGFNVQGSKNMVLPVLGDDLTTPAAGVADADELTADTISATNGFSQASYEISHYRAHTSYRESEMYLAKDGSLGNFLDGKKKQILESFKNRWSTDAASTTADSRSKIMGIRYALSTSNSPGGISQTTDTAWAAQVQTSAGTFALTLIDNMVDTIQAEGRATPDLILAGLNGSSNMFGKIRTAIGPTAERLVNLQGKDAKYGVAGPGQRLQYLGAAVVLDSRAASGEICILSTPSWYVMLPKAPKSHPPVLKQGTDAYIHTFTLFTALGCNDPAVNGRITGIT